MIPKICWPILATAVVVLLQSASAAAQTAPAPDRPADETTWPAQRPLSAQLLKLAPSARLLMLGDTTSQLDVTRGGIAEPDLLTAVSGSARAETLMRSAQRQIPTGTVLMYSGLGVGLGCLATETFLVIVNSSSLTQSNPGVTAALVTGAAVGLAISTLGAVIAMNGYHDALDAINFYNDDLVDGLAAHGAGEKRLSAQLIHIRLVGLGFEYTQDGAIVGDLPFAVAGSPRAAALIRQAEKETGTGRLLFYTGLGIGVPCAVTGLWLALEATKDIWALVAFPIGPVVALLVGAAVGLGMEVAGVALMNSGRAHTREGINAYNADLVDGRLDPPAVRALPQG